MESVFFYPRLMKVLGLIIVLFAAVGFSYQLISVGAVDTRMVSQLMSLGLIFIFFSRDKVNDERARQYKFSALTAGFLAAYLLMYGLDLVVETFGAAEFVLLVMLIATTAYYLMKARR